MMNLQEIEQCIARIREDREHGSRWLVRETILLLRDLAQQLEQSSLSKEVQMQQMVNVARELAQMRPAMAALSSAVGRIVSPDPEPGPVIRAAQQVLQEFDATPELITNVAQPYLHGRLLTCSISGTVVDVLKALHQQIEHVIVTEGRPRYEGRETARLLAEEGLSVTLITDAQAAIFLPLCDAVVVGADSILAQGELLNKSGTALLAWAAQGYHKPFYVLCESLKISGQSWSPPSSALLERTFPILEEKEPEEVWETPLTAVHVRNFYFDCTPYSLITHILTEKGPLDLSAIQAISYATRLNAQRLA